MAFQVLKIFREIINQQYLQPSTFSPVFSASCTSCPIRAWDKKNKQTSRSRRAQPTTGWKCFLVPFVTSQRDDHVRTGFFSRLWFQVSGNSLICCARSNSTCIDSTSFLSRSSSGSRLQHFFTTVGASGKCKSDLGVTEIEKVNLQECLRDRGGRRRAAIPQIMKEKGRRSRALTS